MPTVIYMTCKSSYWNSIAPVGGWQRLAQYTMGLFTMERITFRKPFRIVILTLSWFESLILPFVNAKLFQIRLLKCEKNGVLDRDPPRKPDFTLCECKALSERELCVRILEMRAEAMHGSICAVGTKYSLAVRRSCCDRDGGCNACERT